MRIKRAVEELSFFFHNKSPPQFCFGHCKKGHKCQKTTDWSEGFILCARKQDKIYDAYADIRSYKSQIFQAQALAW